MEETHLNLTDLGGINNPCYSTADLPDGFDDTPTPDGLDPILERDETTKYENIPRTFTLSQRSMLEGTDESDAVLDVTTKSIVSTESVLETDSHEGLKLKALLIAVIVISIASMIVSIVAFILSLWGAARSPAAMKEEVPSFNHDFETLRQLVEELNETLLIHDFSIRDVNSNLLELTTLVNFNVNSTLDSHENSIGNLSGDIQMLTSVVTMESERVNHTLSFHDASIQTISNNLQTLTDFLSLNPIPECGPGNWLRVAYLNMSDPSQQCPSTWREYTRPVRSCGRPVTSSGSCPSNVFSVHGYTYSKVCGRAIGYQYSSTDAFHLVSEIPNPQTASDMYVDGISVTHSIPRTHIWTFAAGHTASASDPLACPCASSQAAPSPSFVGSNFFCESGTFQAPYRSNVTFFSSDPLWDGEGCIDSETQCCNFNSPPWFTVELPSSTSDDIEVRICGDEGTGNEDTPVELLEIYIQ